MAEANCKECGKDILFLTATSTGGFCRPCAKKQELNERLAARATAPVVESNDDEWKPESAHPNARAMLVEPWFWDVSDDNSPFGNDTGADTLSFFREWRAEYPHAEIEKFLESLLGRWDVRNEGWDCLDGALLATTLPKNYFHILTRDDLAIAVAFGQLVLDGKINRGIRRLALYALQRQLLPEVITFRGWVDADERRQRLGRMQVVIEQS